MARRLFWLALLAAVADTAGCKHIPINHAAASRPPGWKWDG